jgi:hypothetical protein
VAPLAAAYIVLSCIPVSTKLLQGPSYVCVSTKLCGDFLFCAQLVVLATCLIWGPQTVWGLGSEVWVLGVCGLTKICGVDIHRSVAPLAAACDVLSNVCISINLLQALAGAVVASFPVCSLR